MAVNPITHNTGGIFRFSDYISQIPDFLKAESDAVVLLQVLSDYMNNAYRNVTIIKKFKFKLIALENNVLATANHLQELADLFSFAESRSTNILFLSKVQDPTDPTNPEKNGFSQDPFNDPPTPNTFYSTVGGKTPRILEFTPSDISKVRSRKVKQVGNIVFYEVFFTATIDNIKDSKSAFEIDADDDGDLTENFIVNYYNHPIINPKLLNKLPYGFSVEFNGVRQNKADIFTNPVVLTSGNYYIQFDGSASGENGFYTNMNIVIDSGVGAGQERKLLSYSGGSKVATIDEDWNIFPDNTSVVSIRNVIKLDAGASMVNNFYAGHTVKIVSGTGAGQIRKILEYRGPEQMAIVDQNWSTQPDTTSLFITIAPDSPNLEWSTSSIFSKTDPCSGGLDLAFWDPDLTIVDASALVPVIPAVPTGKYASNSAIGYTNTAQAYNDITEYSADLSIHVTSGASTDFKFNSAITVGEAQAIPRLMVGLSTYTDGVDSGIYFVISEFGSTSFIYKEKLTNGITLDTLFEGRAKIVFTSSSIDIFWDNNLRYTIPERIIQSKYGIVAIHQTVLGVDSHGFIDNVSLIGNDADLPEENELPSLGSGFFYARELTNLDKRSEFIDFSTGLNKYLDPIFYKSIPPQPSPLQYNKIVDDLNYPILRVPYKNANAAFSAGDRITRWDGFDPDSIQRNNFATILEAHPSSSTDGYLVIDTLNGDWVSQGNFVKVVNNTISTTAQVDSQAFQWFPYSFYYKDAEITYNNVKYKVLKSHESSPSETPESNLGLYFKNMVDANGDSLIIYRKKLEVNPYMFGLYRVKHIEIDTDPDFEGLGFSGLCNDLYVQPAEELDIKFKTKQREWLFNPRLAPKTKLNRNGWMEVTKFTELNTDIVNSTVDIQDGSILFCRQNLFDVTENNPEIAHIDSVTEGWYKYTINKIDWQKTTSYDVNIFPVTADTDNGEEYNIYIDVPDLFDAQKLELFTSVFTVDLFTNEIVLTTPVPATFPLGSKVYLKGTAGLPSGFKASTPFYVVSIDGTFTRLKLSPTFNGAPVTLTNAGTGTHTITKFYNLKNGNVVTLNSQVDTRENGKWKIINDGKWIRLDKRTVMKISDITVEFDVVDNLALADDPIKYTVHDNDEVENYIPESGVKVYKIDKGFANKFRFTLETVEGIDTTIPFQLQYDARFDSNSIADVSEMSKTFRGVPDMGYPLVEKIERLVYQKDPSVIDLELIGYLARFMGYDISQVSDDISESNLYTSDKEREQAIRKMIQNLPQYYALRATETGLEAILLAFGIVGEVIRQWTEQDNPYEKFIDEGDITNYQYSNRENGVVVNLVPTPHFYLRVNVNSNLDNDINSREIGRITENVIRYKPINTVFSGIVLYLAVKLRQRISLSPMLGVVSLAVDVGYDIDFSEQIDNGC